MMCSHSFIFVSKTGVVDITSVRYDCYQSTYIKDSVSKLVVEGLET